MLLFNTPWNLKGKMKYRSYYLKRRQILVWKYPLCMCYFLIKILVSSLVMSVKFKDCFCGHGCNVFINHLLRLLTKWYVPAPLTSPNSFYSFFIHLKWLNFSLKYLIELVVEPLAMWVWEVNHSCCSSIHHEISKERWSIEVITWNGGRFWYGNIHYVCVIF